MPSWELFEEQDEGYRDSVLPPAVTARVTVEEGSTLGWERYAGATGVVLAMHTFRHVRADQGCRGTFWLYCRPRCRCCQADDRGKATYLITGEER